jgi:hypothetical protein
MTTVATSWRSRPPCAARRSRSLKSWRLNHYLISCGGRSGRTSSGPLRGIHCGWPSHATSSYEPQRFAWRSNAPEASSFQRLHSARVAIKQLRDTLELADQVGSRRPPGTLRVLKKAQATLGETTIVKCYSVGSTMFVHRTRRSIPMKLTSRSGWLFQRASVKRIDSPTRRNVS